METLEQQKTIASYTGRLLRDHFGKGPEAAYATVGDSHVIIFLRGFMSPIEQQVLDDQGTEAVHELRESMMKTVVPKIQEQVQETTGEPYTEFFYDWDMETHSGVLVGLRPEAYQQAGDQQESLQQNYKHKEAIEQTVRDISERAEKVPARTTSIRADARTIVIVREGILVPIEQKLLQLGYERVLKITKRELEKEMFYEPHVFRDILGVPIRDIFVDWNFENDKSMVVIVSDPV